MDAEAVGRYMCGVKSKTFSYKRKIIANKWKLFNLDNVHGARLWLMCKAGEK